MSFTKPSWFFLGRIQPYLEFACLESIFASIHSIILLNTALAYKPKIPAEI